MKTKFQLYEKPILPEVVEPLNFQVPKKNPLIPDNFEIFSKQVLKSNPSPALVSTDSDPFQMWVQQDSVFQMPRVVVHIMLYIPQIISSPLKQVCFAVFLDVLIEKVS